MAKQIKIKFEGTEYVLEYNRRTVRELESEGFNPNLVGDKPMTMIPMLVAGAFKMHHRYTKPDVIDDLYQAITDKGGFVQALVELYNEPLNSLIDDPGEGQGNASWEKIG